ncbi:MAG TPA: amidohydrolase family protein [Candidatus Binatia bacterium]|nr:amidohydrolase family protein [Candidatus Binatia bacterium]
MAEANESIGIARAAGVSDRGVATREGAVSDAVDVHTHIFASSWPDFASRHGGAAWPRLEGDPAASCKLYLGATFNRNLTPHAFDPTRRIEDMDRIGVGVQLLSPAPPTFCYWAPPVAAAEWHHMQNDAIAEIVARHPARFLGAGALPLQAPDLAVKELARMAGDLAFPAVEIAGNVDGRDLDDAALEPVWEAAQDLGIAVFVHPQAPILGDARFRANNLTQVAGFPLETALAMTRVVFGGVLDRWPRLRWCFAHGGGAFGYILPRLDRGWHVMDAARAAIPEPPSRYASRVWIDSLTHSPRALGLALETFGRDRIVLGSDYPFTMGVDDPVAELDPLGLDADTRRRLTADNARELLALRRPQVS